MDPFVELARRTIVHFVRDHAVSEGIPPELAVALAGTKAAVFVSIHTKQGELRGCKGTIRPFHEEVAEEIVANAISACSRDTRFPPVKESELDDLEIKVDVLSELERVPDRTHLDPRRYGVLVSTDDGRRGVLLPDLEGVDTIAQQISIACRKAGIDVSRDDYVLQRFTVTRHTEQTPR
jgi:AmmeMemoRadiSam system protein A